MKCNDVEQLLAAYLDNEVTPEEREGIQDHLASCQHCRETLEELTAAQTNIRQAFQTATEDMTASSDIWKKIGQRIEAEEQPQSFISRWINGLDRLVIGNRVSRQLAWKMGAAVIVLVALAIGLALILPSDDGPSDVALVSDITENDPQIREAVGGGNVAVIDVKIINGTGCALAGGDTGYLVQACIDLDTEEVTSLARFGQFF